MATQEQTFRHPWIVAAEDFARSPWTIALHTLREGLRKKTVIAFLVTSILVILGSNLLTSFMTYDTQSMAGDVSSKLLKDICITTIVIFGMLITIFISASVVPNEMDNKNIYTTLSKPVRRYQYLLGKFIGIQLIVIVNLLVMGSLFLMAVWFKDRIFPTLMIWAIFLTYFEFLVVSALTFAISCTSSSSVLPTIAGLFIFVGGNLTEYLRDVKHRAGTGPIPEFVGTVADALYNILPNLKNFSLRNELVHMQPNDPLPVDVHVVNLVAYGLLWGLAGYIIAYLIFFRKEL